MRMLSLQEKVALLLQDKEFVLDMQKTAAEVGFNDDQAGQYLLKVAAALNDENIEKQAMQWLKSMFSKALESRKALGLGMLAGYGGAKALAPNAAPAQAVPGPMGDVQNPVLSDLLKNRGLGAVLGGGLGVGLGHQLTENEEEKNTNMALGGAGGALLGGLAQPAIGKMLS